MTPRPEGSEYLRWAKTRTPARFDLTSSGIPFLPLRQLPVTTRQLKLSGSGAYGWPPLRAAIAARYGVDAECVVEAMGTSMANHLVMAALLQRGDEVLIEHPAYEPLLAVARWLGARIRRFKRSPRDGFRVDAGRLAKQVGRRTRLIVLSNLHNPSSALVDDDTLRAVGEVAKEAKARVLVDEVYLDALWEPMPRTAFRLGPHFVATNSLTKVYGLNGLRSGWILAEPELARRLWRMTELFNNHGVHAAELLSMSALRQLDVITLRSRGILDANTAALHAFYAARPDLDAMRHAHGTVSFPRLRRGSVDALCALLEERYETAVVPGRFFEMPDHFRIGLGVKPATFAAGLDRLGTALEELSRAPPAHG
ncbi:MAG TPA: aminotransferase class I/II-fold pyridoxal phosphate-dependent enzyme [Longimicrobium sp.]|nr:aminotransferase class I/II-fold pyridoxal phosphate-dependent enzyme [Longimicrobium sp.]